jgi:hypothetical protein
MRNAVTIRFTSGREERFEMEFSSSGAGALTRLKAFVEKPTLLMHTGDEVVIIPGSAIECVTVKTQKGDEWSTITGVRSARRIK